MKKIALLIAIAMLIFNSAQVNAKVISNEKINKNKLKIAKNIIYQLQQELPQYTNNGSGPFLAAVYDENGVLIAKSANSVVSKTCSNNHAEMNVIKETEIALNTYDLSGKNLKLYVTAEPCIMCLGGIMWSGIQEVYYGVSSKDVENITGFDEGFKPHWFKEFKKRGIIVYGNIEPEMGKQELHNYINEGKTVYKPERN
jgi:tRNA(Arg) A34 adenosine deaminase TadA